ncbi:hypothetical protein D3C81_2029850 [compost metagenome]
MDIALRGLLILPLHQFIQIHLIGLQLLQLTLYFGPFLLRQAAFAVFAQLLLEILTHARSSSAPPPAAFAWHGRSVFYNLTGLHP